MKNRLTLIVVILWIGSISSSAQIKYYDAASFPLMGKVSEATETRYERLPEVLNGKTRPPVWGLGKNTAGLALRFQSNSTSISLKWEVLNNVVMNHMAMSGIKGFDLYTLEGDKWVYVNTAIPKNENPSEATFVRNMESKEREFMLFFPLYDGVTSLEIGVDSLASIGQPNLNFPHRTKPVVCYGTSILQGGCASRPGMAHTNILTRWLNREVINLGFSGNALLDYEIAEIMAEVDASLFILDFMPNVNVPQIEEKLEKFYSIIREKQPEAPVLFIENPIYPDSRYDKSKAQYIREKNQALHVVFDKLKKQGERNIWLISSEKMIGLDGEATVDGTHFTDLGFMRYAEYLYPYVKKRMRP